MLPLQAGAQRLSALANLSDSGALAAIDGDAIPKLLHLLEHSDDQGAIAVESFQHELLAAIHNGHHLAVASGDSCRHQLFPVPSAHCIDWAVCRREAGGDQRAAAASQGSAALVLVDIRAAFRVHVHANNQHFML
jgi:hypothetical protein